MYLTSRRAFLDLFLRSLQETFPDAALRETIGNKLYVFGWEASSIWIFVGVNIADHEDVFTLEVGWNSKDKYPGDHDQRTAELFDLPSQGIKMKSPVRGGLSFRVGDLLEPPKDVWWDLNRGLLVNRQRAFIASKKALDTKKAKAAVDLALGFFRKHAVPYIASRTGIDLTSAIRG